MLIFFFLQNHIPLAVLALPVNIYQNNHAFHVTEMAQNTTLRLGSTLHSLVRAPARYGRADGSDADKNMLFSNRICVASVLFHRTLYSL